MRGKNGIVNLHDFIDILANYQKVDSKFYFKIINNPNYIFFLHMYKG